MYKPGDLVRRVFTVSEAGTYTVNGQTRDKECYEEIPGVCIVLKEYLGEECRELSLFSLNLGQKLVTKEHLVTKVSEELRESEEYYEALDPDRTGIYVKINDEGDLYNAATGKLVRMKRKS